MKQKNILMVATTTLVGLMLLSSCVTSTDTGDKLKVYTSFYAMEDLVKKVGGDKVEVKSLVPAGQEVHDYEPTTADIVNLTSADMFVYNGAGLEHFVDSFKSAIENDKLTYVEASQGLELIEEDTKQDPHTWLSPLNAKKEMNNVYNALITIDPINKNYYQKNLVRNELKFDTLDNQYKTMLKPGFGKYLVTAHAAFGYLCKEYNLVALPIGNQNAEEEPTQQDIARVINLVKENNIKYIYAEELTATNAVTTICEETGAELAKLNPLEGLTDEDIANNEDYFSIMKDNLFEIAKGYIN